MRRLIKKAEMMTFYYGSPLPRAISILESGSINSINSQGEDLYTEQDVSSLQTGSVYITTSFDRSCVYALNHNQYDFGIVFEMGFDTETEPILIDEDTFYWGEGLKSDGENREKFLRMFDGDKQRASDFIKSFVDSGFFNNLTRYDPYDEYFKIELEDYVGIDNDGYYYMDLSGLQFANYEKANEIIRQIPFNDQVKANDISFVYNGDIDLVKVTKMYLITKNGEKYEFNNPDELIIKYEELKNELKK